MATNPSPERPPSPSTEERAEEAYPGSIFADRERRLENLFLEAIRKKWESPVMCPICRTGGWEALVSVDLQTRYQPGRVHIEVPVRCLNCGYTMLFHVRTLDLLDENANPKGPEQLELPTAPGETT
jgi:hypothetical protein